MSKLYEALQRANNPTLERAVNMDSARLGDDGIAETLRRESLEFLKNLDRSISGLDGRSVGMVGLFGDEDLSTLLQRISTVFASTYSRRCLVLDLDDERVQWLPDGSPGVETGLLELVGDFDAGQMMSGAEQVIHWPSDSSHQPTPLVTQHQLSFELGQASEFALVKLQSLVQMSARMEFARSLDGTVVVMQDTQQSWAACRALVPSLQDQGITVLGSILESTGVTHDHE